ncbi:MAG: aminoacyl-tRNA hydrolase [Lentisphaerae bacterium]|nr:aminoacyl-tRNA hydrolase [Lentisphaerota bacterium]
MAEQKLVLPPEEELEEVFVRTASGPGGQNVNKTSTAVRLVYRFMESDFLSDTVKERLRNMLGGDKDFISILARESRSLSVNRESARVRLSNLLKAALKEPKKRKATKPTRASKERRLAQKARRSEIKAGRRATFND